MTHKLREDVILEKVSGINLLVSLRSAWGESPFVLQIAPITAYIWQCMKNGMDDSEIVNGLMTTRQLSEEKARSIIDHFIRSAKKLQYLLPEEKTF